MDIAHEYVEFDCTSNFSFLCGGSHPEELVNTACNLGYHALGIADLNTFSGVVRAHVAAKNLGFKYHVGTRLTFKDSPLTVLAYPSSYHGYRALTSLITLGKRYVHKSMSEIPWSNFISHLKDVRIVVLPTLFLDRHVHEDDERNWEYELAVLKEESGVDGLFLGFPIWYGYGAGEFKERILKYAARYNLRLIAANNVHYHIPERRPLQDVLTCIRNNVKISEAGFKLFHNAERFLKPPSEISRLFREFPEAIRATLELSHSLEDFTLDQLRYEYPHEISPDEEPSEYLKKLTIAGAKKRYPNGVPDKVQRLIEHELRLINELEYERYFLTCYDIVQFATAQNILCQGRGAAANSAVCYCLGITAVDPERIDTLFERFISKERSEPPDIDIDFEHERREEVIQYIYRKYGRERAAILSEVITYKARSAIRDVGKVLGFTPQTIDAITKLVRSYSSKTWRDEDVKALGLNPRDQNLQRLNELAGQLIGFPRHLSQHVGGFIISERPLSYLVPVINSAMPPKQSGEPESAENRTIIEWDKDDVEALGLLKIDILSLGMLTCIRKALEYINEKSLRQGKPPLSLHTIPAEDAATYEMISRADTVGVFQIESRAQMSMLPRLKPRCFYDLVIEVAIVRPGPIQGNMVHPYLKRRAGLENPCYPDERVKSILGKTLGVPLFQEQAMRLSIMLAGFSPGEAELLRRTMASWKRNGKALEKFESRICAGMIANGYSMEFARSCVSQLKGFSEYGFPESHAASFALLVYASAWIKCHHPAEFAAALLNSQPMGFYQPAQIVRDAKDHGVEVRAMNIRASKLDCSLEIGEKEESPALRIGMRLVHGLRSSDAKIIEELTNKGEGDGASIWNEALNKDPKFSVSTLSKLGAADGFSAVYGDRRAAMWELKGLPDRRPIFALAQVVNGPNPTTPMQVAEEVREDYRTMSLSLKGHPMEGVRGRLAKRGVIRIREADAHRAARRFIKVLTAGVVLVRQKPGSANGVMFLTIEDEDAVCNVVIMPEIYEKYRRVLFAAGAVIVQGKIENTIGGLYLKGEMFESINLSIAPSSRDFC